ncbi:Uncharacterised protein [Rothia dentocariosa]|nr:Uncharacterised protein [Rothia dentocariosa]
MQCKNFSRSIEEIHVLQGILIGVNYMNTVELP